MDSQDHKWIVFTNALLEEDYRSAWLLADEGVDGALSLMESVLLHTAMRANQVPQALSAWLFTSQGTDQERVLKHIEKMLKVKAPLINSEMEATINKSLDEIYASIKDVLYF